MFVGVIVGVNVFVGVIVGVNVFVGVGVGVGQLPSTELTIPPIDVEPIQEPTGYCELRFKTLITVPEPIVCEYFQIFKTLSNQTNPTTLPKAITL